MADFNIAPTVPARAGPFSRRDGADDSLPVAAPLVPRHLRPHVQSFYRFMRMADNVADDPDLEVESKLAYLEAMERALTTGQAKHTYLRPALELRASLLATGVSDRHARQVLRAFRRDAVGTRCHTWSDLMLHCRFSANPLGRYLLELHGESTDCGAASDALCSGLQVLVNLQRVRDDWVALGRCYVPLGWFDESGISVERLVEPACDPKIRAVFDRLIGEVESLLATAAPLPDRIHHRALRVEAAVAHSLGRALVERMKSRDPMRKGVGLPLPQRLFVLARGVARGLSAG